MRNILEIRWAPFLETGRIHLSETNACSMSRLLYSAARRLMP